MQQVDVLKLLYIPSRLIFVSDKLADDILQWLQWLSDNHV